MAQDSETNYLFFENREALVLGGGGARAADQVGVLRAMADWLPAGSPCPFEVLVGTSAGAINAAALAARARRMSTAVDELERVWASFRVEQVMMADAGTMLRAGLHWMFSMVSGGWLLPPPRSIFDTSPLRELLQRSIPLERIPASIAAGPTQALAVATTTTRRVGPWRSSRESPRCRSGRACAGPACAGRSTSRC
jgi:NTE family protein